MNLTEFARERQVEPQAVQRYVWRHEDDFKGLLVKNGKSWILTPEAIDLLDRVYPFPKPIEVLKDYDTLEKYTKALEEKEQLLVVINQLKDKIAEDAPKLAAYDMLQHQLDGIEAEKRDLVEKNEALIADLSKEKERADALEDALQKEKSKGFFARLFGR